MSGAVFGRIAGREAAKEAAGGRMKGRRVVKKATGKNRLSGAKPALRRNPQRKNDTADVWRKPEHAPAFL